MPELFHSVFSGKRYTSLSILIILNIFFSCQVISAQRYLSSTGYRFTKSLYDLDSLGNKEFHLISLKNGTRLIGSIMQHSGEKIKFRHNHQELDLTLTGIRKIYRINDKGVRTRLRINQLKNYGSTDLLYQSTAFLVPKGITAYSTYLGLGHFVETGVSEHINLLFGLTAPDVAVLRAKASYEFKHGGLLGMSGMLVKPMSRMDWNTINVQLNYTYGTSVSYINTGLTYLFISDPKSTDGENPGDAYGANLGFGGILSDRFSVVGDITLYRVEDGINSYWLTSPNLIFKWTRFRRCFSLGITSVFESDYGYTGTIPFFKYEYWFE